MVDFGNELEFNDKKNQKNRTVRYGGYIRESSHLL